MRKKILLLLIILFTFGLNGCQSTTSTSTNTDDQTTEDETLDPIKNIDIYGLNDFHGAIEQDGYPGILNLGSFIIDEKKDQTTGTVFIDQGDMFQGTALSNYSEGGYLIEFMNMIGLDSMTIGNHEFDWGLEAMEKFYDDDTTNFESDFPMLGANVTYTNGDPVEFLEPYTIIESNGVKIGVVGVIGSEIESSISASKVEDYEFQDEYNIVVDYASYLKRDMECDVVILSVHDFDEDLFDKFAQLDYEDGVDAIFGGHTHQKDDYDIVANDGRLIPVMQAYDNGEYLSKVSITVDTENDEIIDINGEVVLVDDNYSNIDSGLQAYFDEIIEDTASIFSEVLTTTNVNLSRSGVTQWTADIMLEKMNADYAFVNEGGIRSQAFPIYANSDVTLAMVVELAPFDNVVKTCEMTGADINKLLYYANDLGYDLVYSTTVTKVNESETYYVVSHEYVFDKYYYPFLDSDNINITDYYYRDLIVEELRNLGSAGWTC